MTCGMTGLSWSQQGPSWLASGPPSAGRWAGAEGSLTPSRERALCSSLCRKQPVAPEPGSLASSQPKSHCQAQSLQEAEWKDLGKPAAAVGPGRPGQVYVSRVRPAPHQSPTWISQQATPVSDFLFRVPQQYGCWLMGARHDRSPIARVVPQAVWVLLHIALGSSLAF